MLLKPEIVNECVEVWDAALDAGVKGTRIAQAVFRVMSRPVYGDKKFCYCNKTILEPSFIQHLSISHNFNYSRHFETIELYRLSSKKSAVIIIYI